MHHGKAPQLIRFAARDNHVHAPLAKAKGQPIGHRTATHVHGAGGRP
jgi:hypothetical protein